MELYVFDRDMVRIGLIEKFDSLIWTRRYWDAGEFKLLVPFSQEYAALLVAGNIVMQRGGSEAAEIRYVHSETSPEGYDQIDAQGKFLLNWIAKRIVKSQIITQSTSQAILYRLVAENVVNPSDPKRKIPNIFISATDEDTGSGLVDYTSEFYANAYTEASKVAKAAKLGFRVTTDETNRKHTFSVYKGRDLTDGNTAGNPPCIFSRENDNIVEQDFTSSIENYKTTAFVAGEEKTGEERKVAETGTEFEGLDRTEVFINATDIKQVYKDGSGVDITLTDAQLSTALSSRGSDELQGFTKTQAFSSKINPLANLKYKEDFDVGDRVTCIEKRWGVKINARIIEIAETHQDNITEIEVTFGESLPSLISTIRQINKGAI